MHNVELVHVTPDAEQLIAYMARVSNPANQDNPDCIKLIKYLIKKGANIHVQYELPFTLGLFCSSSKFLIE